MSDRPVYDQVGQYERDFADMLRQLLAKSFRGQGIWTGEVQVNADTHQFDVILLGQAAETPQVTITIAARRR